MGRYCFSSDGAQVRFRLGLSYWVSCRVVSQDKRGHGLQSEPAKKALLVSPASILNKYGGLHY